MFNSLIFLLIAINPFYLFFSFSLQDLNQNIVFQEFSRWETSLASALKNANPNFLPIRNWGINDPKIQAKAAGIFNFNLIDREDFSFNQNHILLDKNKDEILPIASLTKLMTAVIVFERLDLNKEILVSEEAISINGNRANLQAGERLTVRNLLAALLITSSNDAAYVLAEAVEEKTGQDFVSLMNQKAKDLGLTRTRFADPSGLNSANISTVYDIACLVKYIFDYPLLWQITKTTQLEITSLDGKTHTLVNTDQLLNKYDNIIAGKTGYTQEAQGCLMIIYQQNNSKDYLISVVLGAQKRFLETEKLIDWVKKAYVW